MSAIHSPGANLAEIPASNENPVTARGEINGAPVNQMGQPHTSERRPSLVALENSRLVSNSAFVQSNQKKETLGAQSNDKLNKFAEVPKNEHEIKAGAITTETPASNEDPLTVRSGDDGASADQVVNLPGSDKRASLIGLEKSRLVSNSAFVQEDRSNQPYAKKSDDNILAASTNISDNRNDIEIDESDDDVFYDCEEYEEEEFYDAQLYAQTENNSHEPSGILNIAATDIDAADDDLPALVNKVAAELEKEGLLIPAADTIETLKDLQDVIIRILGANISAAEPDAPLHVQATVIDGAPIADTTDAKSPVAKTATTARTDPKRQIPATFTSMGKAIEEYRNDPDKAHSPSQGLALDVFAKALEGIEKFEPQHTDRVKFQEEFITHMEEQFKDFYNKYENNDRQTCQQIREIVASICLDDTILDSVNITTKIDNADRFPNVVRSMTKNIAQNLNAQGGKISNEAVGMDWLKTDSPSGPECDVSALYKHLDKWLEPSASARAAGGGGSGGGDSGPSDTRRLWNWALDANDDSGSGWTGVLKRILKALAAAAATAFALPSDVVRGRLGDLVDGRSSRPQNSGRPPAS